MSSRGAPGQRWLALRRLLPGTRAGARPRAAAPGARQAPGPVGAAARGCRASTALGGRCPRRPGRAGCASPPARAPTPPAAAGRGQPRRPACCGRIQTPGERARACSRARARAPTQPPVANDAHPTGHAALAAGTAESSPTTSSIAAATPRAARIPLERMARRRRQAPRAGAGGAADGPSRVCRLLVRRVSEQCRSARPLPVGRAGAVCVWRGSREAGLQAHTHAQRSHRRPSSPPGRRGVAQ